MNADAQRAIALLRDCGAMVLDVPGAVHLVVPKGEDRASDGEALLPLRDAARIAGTSVRVLRDAIRAGDLAAFGRQRDRAVRRADLEAWIVSRRVRPVAGPLDADLERRMTRLAREGTR